MQRQSSAIYLTIGVLAIVVVAGGAYYLGRRSSPGFQTQTETPTPALQSQVRKSALPTPTSTPRTSLNSKTYTDAAYNYTIQYSIAWTLKQEKDGEGYARVKLTGPNSTKALFSTRTLPELYIGITSPYSTSGAVCANQSCEEDGRLSVIIKGKEHDIQVIKGAVNSQFNFYAFQFDIPDKKVTLQGFSEPVQLSAYTSFKTMEEGQKIANTLSTLSY